MIKHRLSRAHRDANSHDINPKCYDMTGMTFARLSVLKYEGYGLGTATRWLCMCSCGKPKIINGESLKYGNTLSCGCLQKSIASINSKTHGESTTPLYAVWSQMRFRCSNPNDKEFKNYGGRGISVCIEWMDYIEFSTWAKSAGYGKGLTLDRIDNGGNYCPSNCRWTDWVTQANNSRQNVLLTMDGVTMTAAEWGRKVGIKSSVIRDRLRLGWSDEDAISIPLNSIIGRCNKTK